MTVAGRRLCEFGCGRPATVYGGYPGANDWAGRACDPCAAAAVGFTVWERLDACDGTSGHKPGECPACDEAFAEFNTPGSPSRIGYTEGVERSETW